MKNFKRVLALALCFILAVPTMAIASFAYYDGYTYDVSDFWRMSAEGDYTITGDDTTGDVTIQATTPADGRAVMVTSIGTSELNGLGITIQPIAADFDEDGTAEYANQYSFLWSSIPESRNNVGSRYADGDNSRYGITTGPTAGESSYCVTLFDIVALSWYAWPGQTANDGIADYAIFSVSSNGNFWGDGAISLTTPVDYSQPITISAFNYYSEDDEDFLLGFNLNGTDYYSGGYGKAYSSGRNLEPVFGIVAAALCGSGSSDSPSSSYCAAGFTIVGGATFIGSAHLVKNWTVTTPATPSVPGVKTGIDVLTGETVTEVVPTDAKYDWYNKHTADTDYDIADYAQLKTFAELVADGVDFAGKELTLQSDITLGADWLPIGAIANVVQTVDGLYSQVEITTGKPFRGTFNGNDYTVSGDVDLTNYVTDYAYYGGLFITAENATIKKLNTNINITDPNYAFTVGGVAVQGDGCTFDRVTTAGTITARKAAGIVNYIGGGTITSCSSTSTINVGVNILGDAKPIIVGGIAEQIYALGNAADGEYPQTTFVKTTFAGTININAANATYLWAGAMFGGTTFNSFTNYNTITLNNCKFTGTMAATNVSENIPYIYYDSANSAVATNKALTDSAGWKNNTVNGLLGRTDQTMPVVVRYNNNTELVYDVQYADGGAGVINEVVADTNSGWAQTIAPTCTTKGKEALVWDHTAITFTRNLAALGHTWGEWVETTAPACTVAGVETRTCTVCGATETRETAAAGHTWGEWDVTLAPTCTTAGSRTHTCSVCGAIETEDMAALGHNMVLNYITTPTKAAAGSAINICSRCGEVGEIVSVPYAFDLFWVGAGRNVVSNLNAGYAPYDNNYFVSGSGKVSALDMSIAYGGAFCYFPVTKVTSKFANTLNGFTATIVPKGADIDGDGAAEYPSSISMIWTNKPEQYNTVADHPETSALVGSDELQGHFFGVQPTAGEFTIDVILLDIVQVSWYTWPGQTAGDGIADYFVYRIASNGNYWGDKAVQLVTPVDFSQPIAVEMINEYSEDDEGYLLGVSFNGEINYCSGFGGAFDGISNSQPDGSTGPIFNFGVAAYGFGSNQYTSSFEITEICGSTDVDQYAGAPVASLTPTVSAEKSEITVANGALVNDLFVISGTGYTSYADIKAARDTAAFYKRAVADNFVDGTWSCIVPAAGEYTVLTRTALGEYINTVTATNNTVNVNVDALDATITVEDEVKIVRYALGSGLNTVAAIRAADGYSYKYGTKFVNNALTLTLAPATYSYVVEFVDGSDVFGEFTTVAPVYAVPTITGTAITNIGADVTSIRYAAGTFATVADIKAADGARVVLASYVTEGTYAFRAKYHVLPLKGDWTFAVTYTDGHVEIMNVAMPVATVAGVPYTTLDAAVKAAVGGTVELIDDVVLTDILTITTDVTINGNGFEISGKPVNVKDAANVTINNVAFKTGYVYGDTNPYTGTNNRASELLFQGTTGNIVVNGCSFENAAWDALQATPKGGTLTVTDNTFANTVKGARYLHIEAAAGSDVTLVVTGNTFTNVTTDYVADSAITIYRIPFAKMTVELNKYTGAGANALTTAMVWISNGTDMADLMDPANTSYVLPHVTATGLINISDNVKSVRYAAGTYSTQAQVKRADGARVILGTYIVDGAYAFRAKYHTLPLTGDWTFVINYVDGSEEIVNITF